MSLLINTTKLEGSNAQRRIDEVIAMGEDATVVYSLKSNTKIPNKNESQYNDEQKAFIREKMEKFLYFFGYAQEEGQEDNPTGFYNFPKHSDSKYADQLFGFRQLNHNSLKMNEEQAVCGRYLINDQS